MEKPSGGLSRSFSAQETSRDGGPILFFDGTCILCNGFADRVLRRDHRRRFRLATLQGETAAQVGIREQQASFSSSSGAKTNALPDTTDATTSPAPEIFKTIILVEDGRVYRKSDAVLRVLPHLGGIYRLAPVLRVVPRALRDAVYDLIARNRLRWFGTRATCRMPSADERDRFLP